MLSYRLHNKSKPQMRSILDYHRNVLILTTIATNISLLPPWRYSLKPLTYVMSLILSKKLIFITSYDAVEYFYSSYVALDLILLLTLFLICNNCLFFCYL